jgi:hypothetical protein
MFSRSRWLLVIALVSCSSLVRAQAGESFRFPEAKHGNGELKYRHGIPVLTVEGTPEEIGEQVAALAAKPSQRLLNYSRDALAVLATPAGVKIIWPVVVQKGHRLLRNFPVEYRREFEAMVKTSGLDRELMVIGNTVFDLKQELGALFGCSALLVEPERSPTGGPIFGRNMDFLGLGYLHEYSLVTVYRPRGKHAFAAIGYPGMVGCISGINDAGLALTVLETTGARASAGPGFNHDGTPFALCYRRLLEECTSAQEAEEMLRGMKRTTTNNLALCDKHGGRVLEITPSQVVARRCLDGIGTCTNHFLSDELKLTIPKNNFTTLDRLATLEKARPGNKKLGVADVQRYLNAVNQGKLTLQTMIFEPAALTVHVAFAAGEMPSSSRTLQRIELKGLLEGHTK